MRVLVISDVHGNLTALEAVLKHARKFDALWCLGDVVGYGPNPNECIQRLKKQRNLTCLLGNHDAAAINKLDIRTFNPEARLSIEWMQGQLTPESIEFLEARPQQELTGRITLVHGSPRRPTHEYLLDSRAATENFDYFETDFCFIGHTHLPAIYSLKEGDFLAELSIPQPNQAVQLQPRAILNPGSVGQPRDRDPRAAYVLFDTKKDTWDYRRVEYDIASVQARMQEHSLPPRHVQRLAEGW